jgi:hypothetical protein
VEERGFSPVESHLSKKQRAGHSAGGVRGIRTKGSKTDLLLTSEEDSIEISSMSELDHLRFSFPCPNCSFLNEATIRDARTGGRVICRGCKGMIHLCDSTGTVKKGRKRFHKAIEAIRKEIKLEIKL